MKGNIFNTGRCRKERMIRFVFMGVLLILPLIFNAPAEAKWKKGGDNFCSATTKVAKKSCYEEMKADYYLASGKCINLADESAREECQELARDDWAFDGCNDQYAARKEICDELGEGRYDPLIERANFVNSSDEPLPINNPFLPMIPGTIMTYEGGDETIVVTVTYDTVEILDVPCRVVRDTVTEDGVLVEDTWDWFAQDFDGNVWYFGELSMGYEDGKLVSLEGSWTAGEDGAKPGIVMLAYPEIADKMYRQEFLLGEAEDMAVVVDTGQNVDIGYGQYSGVLVTDEWTPIDPDVHENKYYAPGDGMILEVNLENGERVELVDKSSF
jgi:hypothetical protein